MRKQLITILAFFGLSGAALGQQSSSTASNPTDQSATGSNRTPGALLNNQAQQTLLKSQQEQKLLRKENEKKLLKSETENRSLIRDQAAHKDHSARAQVKYQNDQLAKKPTTAQRESMGLKSQAATKMAKAKLAAGTAAKQ